MSLSIKQDIRFRVYMAFTGICLFGIAIVIKAAMIQFQEGPKLRALAKEMHTRFDTLKADRGNIYNEDGVLLSSSIPEFEVHIDFSVIDSGLFAKNIDTLAGCVANLFADKSAEIYKEEFVRAYNDGEKYYLLGRKLKYYQHEALRSFPIFNKGKGLGGFISDPKEKREAPYKTLAYRTIGIFRDSNVTGLEATYNDTLTGENGRRIVQKSTGGAWVPIEGSEVDPQNGKDIVTTLDMNIQDVAEHALLSLLQKYECLYGTCIVMEVKTGKIRTLVNLGRQTDGSYFEDFNYAMIPTEPGSTFKLVTLLSLLNDKMINVDDIVDAEGGAIRFGNRTMNDSHLGLHAMPIWKAYAESSNAAMAKLANQHYKDNPSKYIEHLTKLHLDQPTGIDLAGERRTVITKPGMTTWSNTTLPWMATGYGILISPLHTCMLYNAIANDGKMMRPYLVSSIREYGKEVKSFAPHMIEQVGDSNTIAQLRKCTRAVVTEGTGKGIESPYYTMSGKTGTAQVADKGIRYTDGVYQGSFVGYMPAEAPKYTICVVIRTKPHSAAYYGGTIAAPVFRMVADKIFSENMGAWAGPLDSFAKTNNGRLTSSMATARNYRTLLNGIKKPAPTPGDYLNQMMQMSTDSSKKMTILPAKLFRDIMPDLKGMGLKDAVYMLETCGLQVQVMGKGKVQSQSIIPGTRINKGQNVILQLS
ncbi:peptidoglycan glycosyltransferase [Flavipsychrobacter stenotrophus]|uniref:Peptidoglycan glycosyltransferase n=1 Tax=Flavipsychrobacter stenotrophus TaxID=2077091 RepID=A0A2S7SW64_9BACT|nr:penicillin-binding protein [Flavipsychrobacter stenotrophus]PQJ10974.1 peptidoglycan glycosyltransferase [Flavipsychrobacter stenotrophus]